MRIRENKKVMDLVNIVAPGTRLREGLNHIIRAKKGALILLTNKEWDKVVDGGFNVDCLFTPTFLYELSKMDGGIVVTKDLAGIKVANAHFIPDNRIETFETGTRHRTAHRLAVQMNDIVIAVSERRNVISIYNGDFKYELQEIRAVQSNASQAIQTLDKYVLTLKETMTQFNAMEFEDEVTLRDAVMVIQRHELIMRIVDEAKLYICELGDDGRLLHMQLNELVRNIEEEEMLIIRDYCTDQENYLTVYNNIQKLDEDSLIESDKVEKVLGYSNRVTEDFIIHSRGYRMLRKIEGISNRILDSIVEKYEELRTITELGLHDFETVEGIGETRAFLIKNKLKKMRKRVKTYSSI